MGKMCYAITSHQQKHQKALDKTNLRVTQWFCTR